MKTVLYISGNTALWICFKRRRVVDCRQELMTKEQLGAYEACPWLNKKRALVHLLVDSEQAEIDAHPLLNVGSSWSYRSNRKALQRRLVQRFPDAIVRTSVNKSKLEAALVQQINLPEATRSWLSHVETGAVTFCSITTVSELLADQLSDSSGGSVIVSVAPDFIRHTYCRSGFALFTRAIAKSSAEQHADQFKQTLDYLNASMLLDNAIPVFAVGLAVNDASILTGHTLVKDVINIDAQSLPFEIGNNMSEQYVHEFSMAWQVLESVATRTNHSSRQVSCAIQKYVTGNIRQSNLQYSAALAVVVFASIGHAFSNELQRSGKTMQLLERKAELSLAIERYQGEAIDLSAKSGPLSSALLDRIALESVAGVSPVALIAMLTEAFTEHHELELQELKWVVVEVADSLNNAEYHNESGMSVSARQSLPSVGAPPSTTKVTLAGKIVQGDSLREQHNAFSALTTYLEQLNTLSRLTVIQAPLTQINGTNHVENGASIRQQAFQLQFDLSRPGSNEA